MFLKFPFSLMLFFFYLLRLDQFSEWLIKGRKNTKSEWWNYKAKGAVRMKKAAQKDVLGTRDEVVKERCMRNLDGR